MRITHPFSGGSYIPGDQWKECSRCGFDYRLSELVKEPDTDLLVCSRCLDEPRDSGLPALR